MKGKDLWESEVEDVVQHLILSYFGIVSPGVWAPWLIPSFPTLKDISKTQKKFQKREGSFKQY